jgi:quinol monooxygenase YgiN
MRQRESNAKPSLSRATRKEWTMPVRLVITMHAKPGKGTELAQAMADRSRAVQQEPGCQQFEVFQSALDPDKLVLLELWADQTALDVHAQVNAARPPNPALADLRAEGTRPCAKTTSTTGRDSPACAGTAKPPPHRLLMASTGFRSPTRLR